MISTEWLPIVQRLHALAQTGLAYTQNDYDRERYEEMQHLCLQIFSGLSGAPVEQIMRLFPAEIGYYTPKVDIRVVIFNPAGEVLMVQEKADDNRWTLPGGWADVGFTPFEVAEKEAQEETGLNVKATRLLAVCDKKKHAHPPQPWYVYKFFVQCQVVGGQLLSATAETSGVGWFAEEVVSALPLSVDRVTPEQLQLMFALAKDATLPTYCD